MTGLSRLEASLRSAANSLRETAVGVDLARFAPGRRENGPSRPSLGIADFELSLGVPIQRTLKVMESMQRTRNWGQPSKEQADYIAWIGRMHRFAQALAGHAWRGIPPELVVTYVDWDDLHPFAVADYISALRLAHPPSLLRAAAGVGLRHDELGSISQLIARCRGTAAYAAAGSAAHAALGDGRFLTRQRARRHAQMTSLTPPGERVTLEEEIRRVRGWMDGLIEERTPFERAMAGYGELVNRSIACLLAWAERTLEVPQITETEHPIRAVTDSHRFRVHITANGHFWHLKVGGPFEVALDGPFDGIYMCVALSLHGLGNAGLADLHGIRLSDLEAAPA
jgi:hypothetical protein